MKKIFLSLIFLPCAIFSMEPDIKPIVKAVKAAAIVHNVIGRPMEILPYVSPYTQALVAATVLYAGSSILFPKKS